MKALKTSISFAFPLQLLQPAPGVIIRLQACTLDHDVNITPYIREPKAIWKVPT
jgi:hypothetical protein